MRSRFLAVGTVVLLGLATVALAPAPEATQGPALLSDPALRIPASQATVQQPGPDDARYLRSRLARIDGDLLASTPTARGLTFNPFDDVTFEIVFDDVIQRGRRAKNNSFVGHVAGKAYSTVVLEQIDEVVVGSVQMPGTRYAVRFAGNGLHSVHEVNPAAFTYEQDDFIDVTTPVDSIIASPPQARAKESFLYLGLYTNAALQAQGSKKAIKAAARLTTTWLTAAFKAQKVKHKVKFKGVQKVKGGDNGDLNAALTGVTVPNDGTYDEAQAKRDQKAADFVGLYIAGNGTGFGFCGLAWRPSAYSASNESIAYHTVREDCNTVHGGSVGAHEFLHNLGGCHPNSAGDGCFGVPGPNGAAHGFIVNNANVRATDAHTTLGTGAICPACAKLLTLSGPKKFNGDKVRDSLSNVADLVNQGATTFSAYR